MLKYKIVPEILCGAIMWRIYTREPNRFFGWRWRYETYCNTEEQAVALIQTIVAGTTYYDQSGERI